MLKKPQLITKNRQIHSSYLKTTIATTNDYIIAIHEDFKYIKSTTN